ncbi:hypothetical protein, conserved [Plasmodium gonderi]|uniref:Uncharacterized protein n=1 Tax=Plasmodium gonderi TaxID=77519 RepID=A0A1Y1JM57_PLAGO|nr:hypothetical protein, conserved [Plasmodium gonderi]GAW82545.1 hypothetical protein, conserved [Plasmodium gonderi]
MDRSFNGTQNRFVLVALRNALNKHNINFVDDENTYDTEIFKNHLKDLKLLKEDIIRNRNQSKELIKNFLEFFFISNGDRSCNFDIFYDKCLHIIYRYLIAYKEINDILYGKKLNERRKAINVANSGASHATNNKRNKNISKNEEEKICENDNDLLYNLINKNLLIYKNKFLFDYDNDSEIYTSSEEEIVIEGRPLKKKSKNAGTRRDDDRNDKNILVDTCNLSVENVNESDTFENGNEGPGFRRMKKRDKVTRSCENRRINLLNRYPAYLRDLIRIVKVAKKREKKILQINFLNKYGDDIDRNKMNTLFNKLYLYMCYMNNKNYIEKKKKRMLYRIVRHNMLKHFYKNHEIFLEKLMKKKNLYNNLSIENVEKLFLSHSCRSSSNSSGGGNDFSAKSSKECKVCKEKMKMLFYITFYDNLNYSPILKNPNIKELKEKNLLTHIFVLKKEKRKTINVTYDICYHGDMNIYMLSKNDIFCYILHENYLKNNLNDLLQRIKNGSKGYNLLYVIFNKYKNKNFLNLKKFKRYLEARNSNTSSRTGSVTANSMTYKGDCLSLRDSFYDILKNNIIKDENKSNIFFDKLFHSFYNILYTRGINISKSSVRPVKKKDVELLNMDEQNSDSDDYLLVDSANGFDKQPNHKNGTNFMMQVKYKKVQLSAIKEVQKKYMNVKEMNDIDDRYIEDGVWQNNDLFNYHYLGCVRTRGENDQGSKRNNQDQKMEGEFHEKQQENSLSTFEKYLSKVNNEIGIVVNSDDSDEDLLCNHGKEKLLMNYLKGKSYRSANEIGKRNDVLILEKQKIEDIKKNVIVHPLINSKCIGFKINVNDIANRNLDIYCINNGEYVNAYKNTVSYLKNQITPDMKKNYMEFLNVKNKIKKKEMKMNTVNNLLTNKDGWKNRTCYINSGNIDSIDSKKSNTVKEYIVVIEENIQEDEYKIDIYNYAELTAYIVNSKKEKKKEFYWNFIRNEIYSHKWLNKLQFKIQNYSNMYVNSYFKKNHLRSIKEYLYGLIINLYYKNIYDISLNIQLSKYYVHYDPTKEYVLKNIHNNLNQLYENVMKCIQSDILNNTSYMETNRITGEAIKFRISDYLMNYRWFECPRNNEANEANEANDPLQGESKNNLDDMVCKYRSIFLFYLLYIYPKFLYILNVIQIKNFKEYIKHMLPEKDDQHVQDAQKDFTSQRKMLRNAKNNHIDVTKEENEVAIDFYLPRYVKNKNEVSILSSFDLPNILLTNFTDKFEKTLFLNVLNGLTKIETVNDEMHPICFKTLTHFTKNEFYPIRKKLTNSHLALIFAVLNSYLCFATAEHSTFFNANKIGSFMIHKSSKQELKRYMKLKSEGKNYFPTDFLHKFLESFLLKKEQNFIVSDKHKCKLMIYILLIQLCLMDNALPVQLTLINRNTASLLSKLNFSIVDKSLLTFNLET